MYLHVFDCISLQISCICLHMSAYVFIFPITQCIYLHMCCTSSVFQRKLPWTTGSLDAHIRARIAFIPESLRQKTFGPPQLALHKAQQVINLPRLLARQQVISSTAVAVLVRCKKPRFHPADSCSQAPSVLCCNMIASSSAPNLLMKYL